MRDDHLPRLQEMYEELRARSATAIEVEAVISALIEELEDVSDAVASTDHSDGALAVLGDEDPETILESEVVGLLKALLGVFSIVWGTRVDSV